MMNMYKIAILLWTSSVLHTFALTFEEGGYQGKQYNGSNEVIADVSLIVAALPGSQRMLAVILHESIYHRHEHAGIYLLEKDYMHAANRYASGQEQQSSQAASELFDKGPIRYLLRHIKINSLSGIPYPQQEATFIAQYADEDGNQVIKLSEIKGNYYYILQPKLKKHMQIVNNLQKDYFCAEKDCHSELLFTQQAGSHLLNLNNTTYRVQEIKNKLFTVNQVVESPCGLLTSEVADFYGYAFKINDDHYFSVSTSNYDNSYLHKEKDKSFNLVWETDKEDYFYDEEDW